jgi:translation initiation factor IF-3
MEKKLWYAIEKDEDDNDWGTGSFDYDEAVKMAHDQNCTIIAVIEDGDDPICVDEIRDF